MDHIQIMHEITENQELLRFLIVLMAALIAEGIVVIVFMAIIRRIAHEMFRGYNQSLHAITQWIALHEEMRKNGDTKCP